MAKKKVFGITQALSQGFSETINVVENNEDTFRNVILPLSRIELDPDNPRKLNINLHDIREGIDKDDSNYLLKQHELESIRDLGNTIQNSGLLNAIVVYKNGEYYRVVAGERRCLASILIGKTEIAARVYNTKPKAFELKLIQWVENTARKDLSLKERIGNLTDIIKEHSARYNDLKMTPTILGKMAGISLPQASYYLSVLNAPLDIQELINTSQLNSLDKAALLANTESEETRKSLIIEFLNGATLQDIRKASGSAKKIEAKHGRKGRATIKVNLGSTDNISVVRSIVEAVISHERFNAYSKDFSNINWTHPKQVSHVFKKMISILEQKSERK